MSSKSCNSCKWLNHPAHKNPCRSCGIDYPGYEPEEDAYEKRVKALSLVFGEPAPAPNNSRPVWEVVIEDMFKRNEFGKAKYGTPLQANNGRNALKDAYEEVLDLAVYLKQRIIEDGNRD